MKHDIQICKLVSVEITTKRILEGFRLVILYIYNDHLGLPLDS